MQARPKDWRPFEFKEWSKPVFGREFYYGNLMIKVMQVPMLFYESSEFYVS